MTNAPDNGTNDVATAAISTAREHSDNASDEHQTSSDNSSSGWQNSK